MKHSNSLAKNTIYLYIRMLIIMLVSLYTTRIVLDILGVTDYGVYNIVGGVAVSLVFIQNALSSATQRYISYTIGDSEAHSVSQVFSMALNIHALFSLLSILFLETIGLYFVNNVLDIPPDRLYAANVVYQCSIFTFILNLLRIPYNALIISYEKMNLYAIFSIFEAALRLSIVFFLRNISGDKLISYAFLYLATTVIINIIYIYASRTSFKESATYQLEYDKPLFKSMTSFLGWNMVGGFTGMAASEGPNYMANIYYGVEINAGLGIAKQVSNAVYSLSSNFQTAFNPRIVKLYASGNYTELFELINRTSVMSFYLIIVFAIPFIFCCDKILEIWLVDVPTYSAEFCILIMVSQIISSISSPLWMAAHAIGNIRRYQTWVSIFNILQLPIVYVILESNVMPYWIILSSVVTSISLLIYRILYLKRKINFPTLNFIRLLLVRCFIPCLISIIIVSVASEYLGNSMQGTIILVLISTIVIGLLFISMGVDSMQRKYILDLIFKRRSY